MDDILTHPPITESYWLDMYVHLLMKCDAMLQLPGWRKSEGCQLEYSIAIGERIPVFQNIPQLEKWRKQNATKS